MSSGAPGSRCLRVVGRQVDGWRWSSRWGSGCTTSLKASLSGSRRGSGQIALATTLVVGFGLHNATEGFGIAAPLAADVPTAGSARRPSWALLLMLGLIGGGPTFLGTWFGYSVTGDAVRSAILGLAGGSILFVVIQLIQIAGKARRSDLVAYGVLVGLIAGFVTDAVVTAGGA